MLTSHVMAAKKEVKYLKIKFGWTVELSTFKIILSENCS